MSRLVHLTVVPTENEAEIICALLRTEGIECDHRSTNLSAGFMDGLPGGGPREIVVAEQALGMPGGGPREVFVHERDLARAQELLAASRH